MFHYQSQDEILLRSWIMCKNIMLGNKGLIMLIQTNISIWLIDIYFIFSFSSGKENIPPISTTPKHSMDSSNEQSLPGIISILFLLMLNLICFSSRWRWRRTTVSTTTYNECKYTTNISPSDENHSWRRWISWITTTSSRVRFWKVSSVILKLVYFQ